MQLVVGWLSQLPMLGVLIALMGLDVFTGLMKAWVTKTVSSSASKAGMMRKIIMLALIAAAQCMETVIPAHDLPWANLVASFFCITELISIAENASAAGVPLPSQMVEVLEKLHPQRKDEDPALVARLKVQLEDSGILAGGKPQQPEK